MAALIGGGAMLQWPIGRLSDFVDRRSVIIGVDVAGTVAALFAPQMTAGSVPWMVVGVGLFGGLTFTLHSLNLARTNDCLYPDEMMQAGSALVLLLGFGSIVGPLAVELIMSVFGPPGFFYWLAGVQLLFVLFGIGCWRYYARRPGTERTPYVAVPGQPSVIASTAAENVYAAQDEDTDTKPL